MTARYALALALALGACSNSTRHAETATAVADPESTSTAATAVTGTSTTLDSAIVLPTETETVPAATVLTEYDNMDFMPADLVITVGDTVEFIMHRSHNAIEVSQETYESRGRTPLEGGFAIDYGTTAMVTFTEVGTHYYVCQPHASVDMVGTITVEP